MKKLFIIPAFAALATLSIGAPAEARPGGCIKGAIIGGIAGHFVHHAGIGAAAGCAWGMHRRSQYNNQNEGRSGYAPGYGNTYR